MELGLEPTPEAYVANMVEVFREVRRVLRPDGVCWLNLGDSYATGAGKVGDCPGGGEQGERWAGSSGSRGERSRGLRDGRHSGKHLHVHAKGPMTQPNRMPIAGLKPKDLVGMPWRVAFALQADGWYLRSDVIWSKPNPMPESVTDRPTKAHEYIFLLTKSGRYFWDQEAVREECAPPSGGRQRSALAKDTRYVGADFKDYHGGRTGRHQAYQPPTRNLRSVWTIPSHPFPDAHFATFPPALAETCIKAGCPAGGTVLDPFAGSGTTLLVADRLQRNAIGIDLNLSYVDMATNRIAGDAPLFAATSVER